MSYRDMSSMRTSPDYMESNKKDGFAQLRQLDVPTFFITITAADMHWTEMLQCMEQSATGVRPSAEEVKSWNYMKGSDVLRSDPVTATRNENSAEKDRVYDITYDDFLDYIGTDHET
ncbi:g4402 [Coccomyxa elongata]